MRNTMIAKKSLVALGLTGALVAVPSLAYADETSDALVDSTLEIIDAPEISAELQEALTPLVEQAVDLEVVDPEVLELVERGDSDETSLESESESESESETESLEFEMEDHFAEQLAIWEFAGETWTGAYLDLSDLFSQCRTDTVDPDCLSVLGADMALTVAETVTEPEFNPSASQKLQDKLGSRISEYYEKLDKRVAEALFVLGALDPEDSFYSAKVALTLANLDEKAAKLEARLAEKAEKLNEKATKEVEKAEEKAAKEADKAAEDAQKAEEEAAKEAEKDAEKAAKEAEKDAEKAAKKSEKDDD